MDAIADVAASIWWACMLSGGCLIILGMPIRAHASGKAAGNWFMIRCGIGAILIATFLAVFVAVVPFKG